MILQKLHWILQLYISHFSFFFSWYATLGKFLAIFFPSPAYFSRIRGHVVIARIFFLPGKTETSPRYNRRVNYRMLFPPRCDYLRGPPPRSRHRDRTSWFFLRDERASTLPLLPGVAFPRGETADTVADLVVRIAVPSSPFRRAFQVVGRPFFRSPPPFV